jgi:hypothetical protein
MKSIRQPLETNALCIINFTVKSGHFLEHYRSTLDVPQQQQN